MIGRTLGHYRILESLGKGGMGEVYLAEDTRLDRRVALKILPDEVAADPDRLSRFTREAKAIAALNHPNIVTIHSVEEAEGVRFLAMEHIEGKSLDHLILKDGMPIGRLLDVAVPLADALAAAHDKGITHRDLKPANVMVTDAGRVKMLDFGLARHVDKESAAADTQLPTEQITKAGLVMGTLPYMSPEQAEGKPLDHRSDIFSLGVLIHEMAAGARPFTGDTSAGVLSSILKDEPPSLTSLREELPADLARVAGRCLMKSPLERFQTARDVFNELRTLQRQIDSGQAVLTGSSPKIGSALPKKSSSLPLVLGIAAVVAVLGLGGWWLLGRGETAGPAPAEPAPPAAAEERTMMVVLPFENLGAPEDDYFAAGMADEITSRLASVKSLGVISRKSAMSYADTDKTIRQIGEELGVEYIVEGTIRWARAEAGTSRVRITPQLIRVSDDTQVWSETYDRVMDDIFEVQAEIATRVTEQLGINLLESDRATIQQRPTENLQAYQDYLRGRDYMARYDLESLTLAVDLLGRALEKDPGFVEAQALAARVHASIMHFGYDQSEARDLMARQAARRALELGPHRPDGHVAMGYYHYHGHKDYSQAIDSFRRAIELRPEDVETLHGMALVLRRQGRWDESTTSLETAIRISPRDGDVMVNLGDNLLEMGRFPEALDWLERAEGIRADLPWVHFYQVFALWLGTGELESAREILETMPPGDRSTTEFMWARQLLLEKDYQGVVDRMSEALPQWPALGTIGRTPELMAAWASHLMGNQDQARRLFEETRVELEPLVASGSAGGERMRSALGMAYAGLGRREEALRAGRRSVETFPLERDAVWGDMNLYDLAWIQALVGDLHGAFDTLESLASIPQTMISPAMMAIDPAWDPLREHPRYTELLSLLSAPPAR